jgi:hypothetical protein
MQYARIIKRASQDLINGRGDWRANMSRIAFYGFLQNIIFSALQTGLTALYVDGEEDDEEIEKRIIRVANGTADSLLRGSGLPGAVFATTKNTLIQSYEELQKDRPKMWQAGVTAATSISPPLNSKVRKFISAFDRLSYKSTYEDMEQMGFSLQNPAFEIGGKLISATTNVPVDRALRKADNVKAALDDKTSATQALFLMAGWSKWDLNMMDKKLKRKSDIEYTPIDYESIDYEKIK